MASAVLFIGWGSPRGDVPVRARNVMEASALEFLLAAEGIYCDRMQPLAAVEHGSLSGGAVLHGERARLDALRRSGAFLAFSHLMQKQFARFTAVLGVEREPLAREPRARSRSAQHRADAPAQLGA